uniref:Protein trichome birefringence-like 23 isoform X1 n=1 Tax=Rhizophora mucronata TaxID=61149 RepID=A0A2P2PJ67_RHIMU
MVENNGQSYLATVSFSNITGFFLWKSRIKEDSFGPKNVQVSISCFDRYLISGCLCLGLNHSTKYGETDKVIIY